MSDFFLHKFGRNPDLNTAQDDVWDYGSNYQFPAVATSTQLVGLANDIPSSDGVHSVSVEGLLADGTEVTEVATLNGATPVVLTNSFYRINRMAIDAVGATGINSGFIDISHSGSATLGRIAPLFGQTQQAVFTMPAGVSGHFTGWYFDAGQAGLFNNVKGNVALQTRAPGQGWRTKQSANFTHTSPVDRKFDVPAPTFAVKPLTDIRVRVTVTNTDDLLAHGGFEIKGFRDIR